MVRDMEAVATDMTITFYYGRRDFQNIQDFDMDKSVLFLDPLTRDYKDNDEVEYSCFFFLVVKGGDLHQDYFKRYTEYIEPLIKDKVKEFKDKIICKGYSITSYIVKDVINFLDSGLDGVTVTMKARQ